LQRRQLSLICSNFPVAIFRSSVDFQQADICPGMNKYLSIILTLACAALVVGLIVVKHGDNAQHDTDTSSINDLSNQLSTAQSQITADEETILVCSNSLEATSNSLTQALSDSAGFSNHLSEAESIIALQSGQITNLNRQMADSATENQSLNQNIVDLTNQIAGLTSRITLTETNLAQANKDYALLENRLRIDVGERLVIERKFNDVWELQSQIENLKANPVQQISADKIYAGLDVEVRSNSFHVIAPN
jgi:chromosome segregation ATPase